MIWNKKATAIQDLKNFKFPGHVPDNVPEQLPSLNLRDYDNERLSHFTLNLKEREEIAEQVMKRLSKNQDQEGEENPNKMRRGFGWWTLRVINALCFG
jgi:hypothetical protein